MSHRGSCSYLSAIFQISDEKRVSVSYIVSAAPISRRNDMKRYKLKEVVEMTGITGDQIRYAERQGHVQTGRHRPFCHYRYSVDEIARLCLWFGLDVPSQVQEQVVRIGRCESGSREVGNKGGA
jgi:hypothetical protein